MGVDMNAEMITIRVHGPLGDKYGFEHRFAVHSPRECIDALDANYPGFRADFLKTPIYAIFVDGDYRDEENCADVANSPIGTEIDFVPQIEGRFDPVTLIAGALTALSGGAIAGTTATILGGIITLGLLTGISLLLAPKQKKVNRDETKDDNYMFSGAENVTEQGAPVPLVYGHCFVGSVVISAGFEVAEGVGGTTDDEYIWPTAATAAKAPVLSDALRAIRIATDPDEHVSPPYVQPDPFAVWRKPRWSPENA